MHILENKKCLKSISKFLLKKLEKELLKCKVSRKKEITRIRAEINEIENKKSIKKITRTKSSFLKKINKCLTRLRKTKEKTNY